MQTDVVSVVLLMLPWAQCLQSVMITNVVLQALKAVAEKGKQAVGFGSEKVLKKSQNKFKVCRCESPDAVEDSTSCVHFDIELLLVEVHCLHLKCVKGPLHAVSLC